MVSMSWRYHKAIRTNDMMTWRHHVINPYCFMSRFCSDPNMRQVDLTFIQQYSVPYIEAILDTAISRAPRRGKINMRSVEGVASESDAGNQLDGTGPQLHLCKSLLWYLSPFSVCHYFRSRVNGLSQWQLSLHMGRVIRLAETVLTWQGIDLTDRISLWSVGFH